MYPILGIAHTHTHNHHTWSGMKLVGSQSSLTVSGVLQTVGLDDGDVTYDEGTFANTTNQHAASRRSQRTNLDNINALEPKGERDNTNSAD